MAVGLWALLGLLGHLVLLEEARAEDGVRAEPGTPWAAGSYAQVKDAAGLVLRPGRGALVKVPAGARVRVDGTAGKGRYRITYAGQQGEARAAQLQPAPVPTNCD
ncbi:hypothetical protein [Hyalangium sp.]|uniref:hypothetical protein n=1 Tax=Hyalangium sp. TaxID=2028555 RepID=UPI002D2A5961|nr:hypothetical protein [Hyalangium sp.]HYI00548.1 hypothetical protein [Hyalangium sp.]